MMVSFRLRNKAALFLCLLVFGMSSMSFVRCSAVEQQRDLGGAAADKPYLERWLSGVSEGLRFVSKAVGDQKRKRSPKQVRLALVGFGRTGTTSIVSALQLLGYTFVHDDTVAEVSDVYAKLSAKTISIDDFVEEIGQRGFDAIFLFSDEFIQWTARTDDVQVLLTKRDNAKKWAESWLTVTSFVDSVGSRPFIWSQTGRDMLPYFQLVFKHLVTQGQPEKYKDLATLQRAYESHLVKVRKMIPDERLLEFNVKEGWEPLCQFLHKPVPDIKFPARQRSGSDENCGGHLLVDYLDLAIGTNVRSLPALEAFKIRAGSNKTNKSVSREGHYHG
eukprot:CAMPEP_0194043714 /NCGR_PEP_ID=MMETSP0009_2-20130614/15292_1 /TAXON_ID=210454 /ORGANISM="Grammatophora oceanica, Strain CCMP 410" /LENGTH=331 /DNA_ID=CAMNT_0038688017 /DNA_START=61 /DNA_END=1055 /DNA_ORIENTATION=+